MNVWRILQGDVCERLASLPAESVQACVTSPPYWGLRDYGTATWDGGDPACDHALTNARQPTDRRSSTLGGGVATIAAQDAGVRARATCGKCGAKRIDAQIGLEPTPSEYVARMVEVFAEVHRVLREDGTLWLNLGDSYAANRSYQVPSTKGGAKHSPAQGMLGASEVPEGLKPKDLVGIPWSVAKALQAPRYHGHIKDECDRIWLAAMLDAEGCMFIHKRKAGQHNGQGYQRKSDNYAPGVEICNTSAAVVERVMALVGKGSICTSDKGRHGRKQTLYRWNLRTTESREFVREVYPYLVAKQQQARILCGCPSSGERAEAAHAALIALHNGIETDVDFPAPGSLYTPGWYLRSEIIWAKSNPMPESVTDRPTKSHEQIFLFSKSARYYYDADAIKEESAGRTDMGRMNRPGRLNEGGQWRTLEPIEKHERNKRSVWTVATQAYEGAHFATYPEALIEPCILAGSSERGQCPACGAPWERVVERTPAEVLSSKSSYGHGAGRNDGGRSMLVGARAETIGWKPSCACDAGDPVPQLVLDPFTGSGTTGAVAIRHQRSFLGTELNPAYIELARKRIGSVAPMFARECGDEWVDVLARQACNTK